MAFLKVTQQILTTFWSAPVGQIIDDTGSPEYWKRKANFGYCKYVSDEEAAEALKVLAAYRDKPVFRPAARFLTNLAERSTRLKLPEQGSFNPGLAAYKDGYILIYRPDEYRFTACHLNKRFKATGFFPLNTSDHLEMWEWAADPRLIWHHNKLFVVYASFTKPPEPHKICIKGTILMDLNQSDQFIRSPEFRISPPELAEHQKNWMPFVCDDELYFVAQVCPHIVYRWTGDKAEKVSEVTWDHPWMFQEFLRGNCNCVQLPDGRYLGTFHTATMTTKCVHYDNGAYIFEGKPPFKPLKSANRSFLPADAALEPHFRKEGLIRCIFPVGMVLEGNKLLISYGDNDSACRIMSTTIEAMEQTTVELYESEIKNISGGDQLCTAKGSNRRQRTVARSNQVARNGRSKSSNR